ncbi:squalene/phytoene synthase family protein [Bacillus sp. FJAT-45350]|uniref:squalene/phytoene synthase family protein n=1 Tax=Bacillus sp. FJAT-45350 TaxID=2011014 RepID=UPI000BB831CF|nr:phytoene/squalene synthase family protein [Bacillus sp. FJAT-45350]
MSEQMELHNTAMEMLKETSRTFYIPITFLPDQLKEAVASAYLAMRAIDEIEDHPEIVKEEKAALLRSVAATLSSQTRQADLETLFKPYSAKLPDVSLQLEEWISFCPEEITPQVIESTTEMAEGMAKWVERDFSVTSKEDLDEYTYYVAGLVGTLLSKLWEWYDNTKTDNELAIAFGRGLQAVNIIRNRTEDLERGGVDFFPEGWELEDMFRYARSNLNKGQLYLEELRSGPILYFCKIPLALAIGTLDAIEKGHEKLSRDDVFQIVNKVVGE